MQENTRAYNANTSHILFDKQMQDIVYLGHGLYRHFFVV